MFRTIAWKVKYIYNVSTVENLKHSNTLNDILIVFTSLGSLTL